VHILNNYHFDSSAMVSGSSSTEAANTVYLGDQRGLLGFKNLTSVGAGIEFDSSQYKVVVTRTRIVARYAFGQDVRGFAIGLSVSF